mmetsp:Transcript_3803/g.7546  ORF Transcript_3803/g.7546 Transcript_3803/m.7546 type:complete len:263 (-) Transcript_3803:231-1019(-)
MPIDRSARTSVLLFRRSLGPVPTIGIGRLIARPQGQVVSEQLHDQSGILVALFRKGVELGNGVVEGLLGDMAGAVGAIENFVVKDGEVEGETEADGVSGGKVRRGDLGGGLVGVEGGAGGGLPGVSLLEFGEVAVVVSLHLVVKDLGLLGGGVGDEALLDDGQDVVADVAQLVLDLDLVVLDDAHFVGVSLLLDGGHHAPGGTTGADYVLIGDGEQISLFNGEFLGLAGDFFHVADHFIEALGLLGELGFVDERIAIHFGDY